MFLRLEESGRRVIYLHLVWIKSTSLFPIFEVVIVYSPTQNEEESQENQIGEGHFYGKAWNSYFWTGSYYHEDGDSNN